MSEIFPDYRPYILSLHPTMQCDFGCTNCYLKKDESALQEKSQQFFSDILVIAKKVGIKEIALPINYTNTKTRLAGSDKNFEYFNMVGRFCKENSVRFTSTANYDFFKYYENIDLHNLDLVSISINDFVTGSDARIEEALQVMKDLKARVPRVNCNILLSDKMVNRLLNGLHDKILDSAHSMYLLSSKPFMNGPKEYYEWFMKLTDNGINVDSPRIIMDSCIKYAMGLTGNICDRHKMIYLNPYGEIKMCSFDSRNLAKLQKPEDFKNVFEKLFPMQKQSKCDLVDMGAI